MLIKSSLLMCCFLQPIINPISAAAAAAAAVTTSAGLADGSGSMVAIAGMVRWIECSFFLPYVLWLCHHFFSVQ